MTGPEKETIFSEPAAKPPLRARLETKLWGAELCQSTCTTPFALTSDGTERVERSAAVMYRSAR